MTTGIARSISVFVPVVVAFFSLGLFAQSKTTAYAAPTPTPGLYSTLADLSRLAPATNQHLASLHVGSGRLHWVTFWRRGRVQRSQIAAALRRNLQFAVPSLIHDAQVSGGSISSTFKLYKDLSAVCESLDSLLPPGPRDGNTEMAALNQDLADLNRIREQLSFHIQQAAAAIESKNPQLVLSAGGFPKKIIIDDTVPEKPAKKHRPPSQ